MPRKVSALYTTSGATCEKESWGNYYRVNVILGDDPGCAKIVRSYFLETDGAGHVVESTPAIVREEQLGGREGNTRGAGENRP